MAKTVLSVVETAYRGVIEEQDDTILWLNHALKNSGLDVSVLLRANAVNYAVKGQDASGLRFGDVSLAHAPEIHKDLEALIGKGVTVYLVREDAQERGIEEHDLLQGVEKIARSEIPRLFDRYEQVWHW
jgi:sulfur relay (sulfurtransferase) DsrF/TusC family protein